MKRSSLLRSASLTGLFIAAWIWTGVTTGWSPAESLRVNADEGDPEAQNTLGRMYKNGTEFTQDYAQALKWLWKAADQDDASAQNHLAVAYAPGQGIAKDVAEAYTWFALCATQGDNKRSDLREDVKKETTPKQIADAEKRVKEFKPGK